MSAQPAAKHLHSPAPSCRFKRIAQGGFTLLELIAVIVILGILAAYIFPRYAGITDEALRVSAQAAGSEGYTRLKGASQLYLIDTTTQSQQLSDLAAARYLDLEAGNTLSIGGFVVKYTQGGAGQPVTIKVYSTDGSVLHYTMTQDWP